MRFATLLSIGFGLAALGASAAPTDYVYTSASLFQLGLYSDADGDYLYFHPSDWNATPYLKLYASDVSPARFALTYQALREWVQNRPTNVDLAVNFDPQVTNYHNTYACKINSVNLIRK